MFYRTQSAQISMYVLMKVLAWVDIHEGRPVLGLREPIAEKKPILKRQRSEICVEVSAFSQLQREAFRPVLNSCSLMSLI